MSENAYNPANHFQTLTSGTFGFSGIVSTAFSFPNLTAAGSSVVRFFHGVGGPGILFAAYSFGGTDSDCAMSARIAGFAVPAGDQFSAIASTALQSTALATNAATRTTAAAFAAGDVTVGRCQFGQLQMTLSKTAVGAATVTFGLGLCALPG